MHKAQRGQKLSVVRQVLTTLNFITTPSFSVTMPSCEPEMGYLTVLHVSLGAKIGDLHAKDSHSFRKRQIPMQKCKWGLMCGFRETVGSPS